MENGNNIQNKLIDYIDKNLSEQDAELVENQINSCKNFANELTETAQLFHIISKDTEEIPSADLRLNFEKALSEEKEKQSAKIVKLESNFNWRSSLRIVASIALIVSAFFIGKYQSNTNIPTANRTTKKEKEVLAMLDNQLASKRIQAISLSEKINTPNNTIIEALINRLFNDKNTNVRLASAEALVKFSSLNIVRNALIKALETDKEPTVQIELIQILAKIQEKRALEPMQKLLEKEETPNYVKKQLQYNIPNLL